jgi:hypothetical protein
MKPRTKIWKPPTPKSLKKQMEHNPPQKEGLCHERILVVEPNVLLTGLEKTPMILNPYCPHIPT